MVMANGSIQTHSARYLYQQQHSQQQPASNTTRAHPRNGSPVSTTTATSTRPYLLSSTADTSSPTRSPGTRSPAFGSMYNHTNHRQAHGVLNGNGNYQTQMNLAKHYQSQNHGTHHLNNAHHEHGTHTGGGAGSGYGNHQHTVSTSTLSNTTPHFTPAHLQQNGTPSSSSSLTNKPLSEYHAIQLQEYEKIKNAGERPHFYARTAPHVARQPNSTPAHMNGKDDENRVERRRTGDEPEEENVWQAIDFGGQGLKCMASSLFRYNFLKKIYFNHNKLSWLPVQIGEMRNLTILDLSFNELYQLPQEIGMLTNLKRLLLFENKLSDLPFELGSLYQLEVLGLEGNPMRHDYMDRLNEKGSQDLIRFLREQAEVPAPPEERQYISLDDSDSADTDKFTVLSWNILCDRAATQSAYGYTPSEALNWSRRQAVILSEIERRNADIICLQEVDVENYAEFFRPNLASHDYRGVYWPKARAQTMGDKESRNVDGCATFYKNSKYILLDKQLIVFSREAINRPDMKGEHDIYNRVMPRDHIAVVTFLENRQTGSRIIVVNVHLAWEPWFKDVKVVQVAIMMDQLTKIAEKYSKWPACTDKQVFRYANEDAPDGAPEPAKVELAPSMKYDDGTQIPMMICSDMNSTRDSGVYELVSQGTLSKSHPDLTGYKYGDFSRNGMSHPFSLKSSYGVIGELPFTDYTTDFKETIDYVWFSTNAMQVIGLLGEVDPDYLRRVPGFPNYHFPSDHIALWVEFAVRNRKERKQVEADFGSGAPARRSNR